MKVIMQLNIGFWAIVSSSQQDKLGQKKKSVNCTKQNLNWAKTFYQPSRKVANEGEDKVKKGTKGAVESMKNLDNKVAKK